MLLRLLRLVWKYRWRCTLVLLLQLILLALGMGGLALVGLGVDVVRYEIESNTAPPDWPFGLHPPAGIHGWPLLLLLAGSIIGFAVLRSFLNFLYGFNVARLVQGDIVVYLRSELYEKMQRMDFRFFDSNASSSLINRITGDVQSVRLFVDGVIIPAIIMVLSLGVYVSYMVSIHLPLTIACLAPMPLILVLSSVFSKRVQPKYRISRGLFDNLVLWMSECIHGVSVVKAFAFEQRAIEQFEEKNHAFRSQQREIFQTVSLFTPAIGSVTHLTMVVLLAYGGWLVIQDRISLGAGLIVFAGLLQQFSGQISNIGGIMNSVQQSLTAARRVFEIIDARPEIQNRAAARPLVHPKGRIVLENVSFSYQAEEDSHALENVNLTAEPGQCIGIIGPTGSGKSTLLSLIPRFYDPARGRVLVDGHDVRDLTLESLRARIGLVFQESFLFAATVAENIAFGRRDAKPSEIEHAARLAAAHDFILELPDGYDTLLREGGASLSGGQRQRLALARALLHDPRILLLDDPTAALDTRTEREILDGVERAIEGRTVLLATHRISALRRADWIVVLEGGRIVQQGTPDDLILGDGYFQTLAKLQQVDSHAS